MAPTKQSTRCIFTLNNYTDKDIELLKPFYVDYCKCLVCGKEVGEVELTPHLQGFFTLKTKLSMTGVHRALGTKAIALMPASGTSLQAANYCKKGEQTKEEWNTSKETGPNFGLNYQGEEFGEVPTAGKRTDLDTLCDAVQEGKPMKEVANIHPASHVRNYRGLAALQALNNPPYKHESICGIYYWGPPGTGKSHTARGLCPPESLFIKPQNKWWDGYVGESHVLLDDLDSNTLGHHLKIWSDKCACSGEIKGGVIKLSHATFIITSNYSIDYLWNHDPDMASAIKRHFKVVHMTEPYIFKPQTPVLTSKTNHIFGTIPMGPCPTRDTRPLNPCMEVWRKNRNSFLDPSTCNNSIASPCRATDYSSKEEIIDDEDPANDNNNEENIDPSACTTKCAKE